MREGEGSPTATPRGEENAIFSWREIARCFWATGVCLVRVLAGNRMTIVACEKDVSLKA